MRILYVAKKDGEIDTSEMKRIFEETDELEVIKQAAERCKERIYVSWASVEAKDLAGEVIPMGDLEKQQKALLERNGPITDEHTNRVIGQTLAYKIMSHPETGKSGILHLNKIFNHNDLDDQVWKEIKSGERTGSSVGGINSGFKVVFDPTSGERATSLEGFKQFETASVFKPCNPYALNEAVSAVAKSNNVKKPEELDSCVRQLMDDTDFKPEDSSQTKEEAAYAVCTAAINKRWVEKNKENLKKAENVINKFTQKKKTGDTMDEEIKKSIDALADSLKALKDDVEQIKSTKKQEEMEEDIEEDEEKKKKETKKEDAKGDIEPESDAPQTDSPNTEDSNDKDVYKKAEEMVSKKFEELNKNLDKKFEDIKKASTPKPPAQADVKKADEYSNTALEIAMGTKKMPWTEVHKKVRDGQNALQKVI